MQLLALGSTEGPTAESYGWTCGVLRHLLLLLPFLLFDLLHDEVKEFNSKEGTHHISPANKLITLVLALLESYHLYR